MARKVYVDIGSNHGHTIRAFQKDNPDFIVFAFEPTPHLAAKLRSDFADFTGNVHVMEYAAWISDGVIEFYFGDKSDQSSTLLKDKKAPPEWTVDYKNAYRAQSIDFDRWLRENTSESDFIVVKMDIEGAEYKVLQRLLDSGSINRIAEIRVEWHWDRYPAEISKEDHIRIREKIKSATKMIDWI